MPELTLESLAKRVEALEQQLKQPKREKDWRRVIGNSEDNEFTRTMWAEIEAAREAEREAARQDESP